tara:strand:+ start:21440 stop:21694 length:255 start_codon:yes stop_codon:yes gene_type:complete
MSYTNIDLEMFDNYTNVYDNINKKSKIFKTNIDDNKSKNSKIFKTNIDDNKSKIILTRKMRDSRYADKNKRIVNKDWKDFNNNQ